MSRFLLSGAAGAVMGMVYEAISWYNTEYYPVNNLSPTPVAFYVDPAASHIYARFSHKYKKHDPVAYIASQQNTDSLLNLEDMLTRFKPKSKDLQRAERYHKAALMHARKLCKAQQLAEKRAFLDRDTEELLASLEELLNRHLQNVTGQCQA